MYIIPKTVKGHDYYYVLSSKRGDNSHWKDVDLYLGRLDNLDHLILRQKSDQIHALSNPAISFEFDAILVKLGYPPPPPSLLAYDLKTVRSYGPELALVRIGQDLNLIPLLDSHSPKGGGPSLGKMTLSLAIYMCIRPGSISRFVEWYRRSPLPIFLDLPPEQVTYDAALNTLDYLQPMQTRPLEAETYARVRKVFNYHCERVDIDSTTVELEGTLCRVIAKFGRSKKEGKNKRRQVIITFIVDQRSALVGHEVFPGNKGDSKTLASIDRRLRKDYDDEVRDASRVVDRGYASLANVRSMQRKKDKFLVALKAHPERLKLLEAIGIPHTRWTEIAKDVSSASVVQGGLKYVVIWNDEVAEKHGDGRKAKIRKAREALKSLAKSVANGRIKSRAERDQKVGAILRRCGVSKFLTVQGARKGFGFTVEETGKAKQKAKGDGYQVFVTTELGLTEKDVFEAYRARDRIEKAIRILKSVLGLGPLYVTTREHVLGNIYIHALAYQLRTVMKLRLEDAGMDISPEEALWELEKLQVAELIVKGDELTVHRKMTEMDGVVTELSHVLSLLPENEKDGV
jgi:transposase